MDEQTAITVVSIVISVTSVAISVVSVTIGAAGFLFGVYKHFSTLRVAKIRYTVTQLTDYDLPNSILASLAAIPFVIELSNTGNKQAENINIRITTASNVDEMRIESGETYEETQNGCNTQIRIPVLNPGETIRILGQCAKVAGLEDYVKRVEVTHTEGLGEKAN